MPRTLFLIVVLAAGASQVAGGAVQQQPDYREIRAFDRFARHVGPHVERIIPQFPPGHELVVTYHKDAMAALRVQTPVGGCDVSVWFVPDTAPSLYDQLEALFHENRDLSALQVEERVVTVRDTRRIPCNSSLGALLRRGVQFSNGVSRASTPPSRVYVDTEQVSVDVFAGDLETTMTFPYILEHPIGQWTRELRAALTTYIASGFDAR